MSIIIVVFSIFFALTVGGSNPGGEVRGPLQPVAGSGRWFSGGAAGQRAGRVSLL